METALKNYIRTMFAMSTTPTWNSGYDGTIFYDQSAKKWITGNNTGWQIIDRNTTYLANEIFSLLWIDTFEYPNDSIIRNNYIASSDTLQLYSENNLTTYGDYALKCVATISGSKDEFISKLLDPMLSLKDMDTISFDIKSNRIGTNLQYSLSTKQGWLGDWAQRRKISIDADYIDTPLTHFPIAIPIGTSVGRFDDDVSDIFSALEYTQSQPSTVDDDFTGVTGAKPNAQLWVKKDGAQRDLYIYDNKLRLEIDDGEVSIIRAKSVFILSGNFDVQVDWQEITQSPTSNNFSRMWLSTEDQVNLCFIGKGYYSGADQYMCNDKIDGSYGTTVETTTSDTESKVRITRIGPTITFYYWGGSSWTQLDQRTSITQDLKVWLSATTDTTAQNLIVDFDNFLVNSGTIIWPAITDNFTGSDGDAPNTDLWLEDTTGTGATTSSIQDNTLELTATYLSSIEAYVESIFHLSGDFDIQVDFEINLNPDSYDDTNTYLRIFSDSWDARIRAQFSTTRKFSKQSSLNGWGASSARVNNYGKLRITRTGSDVYFYHADGTGNWVLDTDSPNPEALGSEEIYFRLGIRNNSASEGAILGAKFDNLIINSGTIVWPENTQPNYKKIAITKSNGETQLYGEIEYWDSTNEKAVIWVSSSDLVLSSSTDTDLYIYYDVLQDDNDVYIAGSGGMISRNIWDGDFKMVFHMAQDPSEGVDAITDSTTNNNHGTCSGTMTSSDLVDGTMGKAIDFDGSDDYIAAPMTEPVNITAECRFYNHSDSANGGQHRFIQAYTACWSLTQGAATEDLDQDLRAHIYNGSTHYEAVGDDVELNTWVYGVLTYDGTNLKLYQQGVLKDTVAVSTIGYLGDNTIRLGTHTNGLANYWYDGLQSENRISSVARSADWIKATNETLNDNLIYFSTSEEIGQTITSNIQINNPNTYQTEIIDIGSMDDYAYANVKFKVLNDAAENTFYVDNMYANTFSNRWVDSYEYPSDNTIRSSYTTTDSGTLQIFAEDTIITYGSYALKGTAVSGSQDESIVRLVNPVINLTNKDRLRFDTRSNRVGTNTQLTLQDVDYNYLGTFSNIMKVTIDSTNIDSNLTHFPVPIVLGTSVGQSSQDISKIFDELIYPAPYPSTVDDDFTGENDDAPNSDLWNDVYYSTNNGTVDIQSNKLRFNLPADAADEYMSMDSKFKISGDFDIQIDYDEVSKNDPTSSTSTVTKIQITDSIAGTYSNIGTLIAASNYIRSYVNGTTTVYTHIAAHYDTGKLRIKRTGSVIKGYYWTGSQWEWNSDTAGFTFSETSTGEVSIKLMSSADFDGGSVVEYDNFLINSGTTVWPVLADYFTGTDDDAPDTALWTPNVEVDVSIQSNKLNTVKINDTGNSRVKSNFFLTGDFDIQVDFDLISVTDTDRWYTYLTCLDGTGYNRMNREYHPGNSGNEYRHASYNGTSWYTEGSLVTTSDASGKLRMVRSGSSVSAYYGSGSSWILISTASNYSVSGDVYLQIGIETAVTAQSVDVDFDNFQVNSGTIVWPEGTHPNRKKIAVTKSDRVTQLYSEIETWDAPNEKATIWVSKDDLVLSSSEDTELYFYYDSNQPNNNEYISDTSELNIVTNITGDNFTGTNGEAPNTDLWITTLNSTDTITIQSNMLANTIGSTSGDTYAESLFILPGDFDISMEFANLNAPAASDWLTGIRLVIDSDDWYSMHIGYRTGADREYRLRIGSGSNTALVTTDTEGKFRLVRSGTTLTGYWWHTSNGWTSLDSVTCGTGETTVKLLSFSTGQSFTVSFDDFLINSGTVLLSPGRRVWDTNYKAVYHMAQDPNGDVTDAIKDSTINNNHGTPVGTMLVEDSIDGLVGKAIDFDGTDDAIEIPGDSSIQPTDVITFQAIAYKFDWSIDSDDDRLFGNTQSGGYQFDFATGHIISAVVHVAGDYRRCDFVYSSLSSGWHLFTGSYDGNNIKIYVDGDLKTTNSSYSGVITQPAVTVPLVIAAEAGATAAGAPFTEVAISFVSVENVVRDEDWIKAFYNGAFDELITFELDPSPATIHVTHDIYINNIDIYQNEIIDITSVSGTVNKIEFKILNDDLDNTFYIDKMYLT